VPGALDGFEVSQNAAASPAVLLFHGLGQNSRATWFEPALTKATFHHERLPNVTLHKDLGDHDSARVGFVTELGVTLSDAVRPGETVSWHDALKATGFTIGFFDRHSRTVVEGMDQAKAAFLEFLDRTHALNPAAPPPVVLLSHSQGGLFIRRLLKDLGTQGRVRAVVTLNAPHQGSGVALWSRLLGDVTASWMAVTGGIPPPPQLAPLVGAINAAVSNFAASLSLGDPAHAELLPGSAVLRDLAEGETPQAGVRYLTVGGTSPEFIRLYAFGYTGTSVLPTTPLPPYTFHWAADLTELPPPASPLFDTLGPLTPEFVPGLGDGLVTDASAHLPLSFGATHITKNESHVEVLHDPGLMAEVINRLQGLHVTPLTIHPASVVLQPGETQRFQVEGAGPVQWEVLGPAGQVVAVANALGQITQDGVYTAPSNIRDRVFNRVLATALDGSTRVGTATVAVEFALVGRQVPFGGS
jgi:hypothetical protein